MLDEPPSRQAQSLIKLQVSLIQSQLAMFDSLCSSERCAAGFMNHIERKDVMVRQTYSHFDTPRPTVTSSTHI